MQQWRFKADPAGWTGCSGGVSALFLLLLLLIPLNVVRSATHSGAESGSAAGTAIVDPPALLFNILDQGGPRTVATNWGYIGSYAGRLLDTARGSYVLPWEYPSGSGIEYLYDAGLWVGGIVGGDTLVSTGTVSYWARHELFPDTGSAGALIFDDYYADAEFAATCTDTFSDPNIAVIDLVDGLHRPLNVLVRQKSRAWTDPVYRDLIWTSVTVINLGMESIEDAFVGWMADPDIGHVDLRTAYADDLVGYYRGTAEFDGQTYPVEGVYAIDNDGDADTLGAFTGQSPLDALGLMILPTGSDSKTRSFNWWVYNSYLGLNWGPHHLSSDPAFGGRPLGDAARYRMLSNGEVDYDQVFAAVDMTGEGWAPPPDTIFFAAGFDIRFLYSIGPYTITPGDSVTLNFVWVAGSNIHTDPAHYLTTFSFEDPEPFLAGLDFSDLGRKYAAAQQLYASDFAAAAPGPPAGINLASWTTNQAALRWSPKGTFDLAGYEIFRRETGAEFPDIPLAVLAPDETAYTDFGLSAGEYFYTMRSRDIGGRLGPPAAELNANLMMPMPVVLHAPTPSDGGLALTWQPSPYPDVAVYHIERLQEIAPGETTSVEIGLTADVRFTDGTVDNATVYVYCVTAESGGGVIGPPSNRVKGMAMAFDQGPLILDQTPADPSGLTDKDSVRTFWRRIVPEAVYRDADPALPSTLSLADFNHHPVTIVVSTGLYSETEQVRRLLTDYDIAGGGILIVGRDLFNIGEMAFGDRYFGPGDLEYDCFGLTRIHYPPTLLSHPTRMNAEFIGARSCRPRLPDLAADPDRTDWGIPAQLQPVGPAIPFVGWIEGDPTRTSCLFTYESMYGELSAFHGKTAGLLFDDGANRSAVVNFPLSMMEEKTAEIALRRIIAELQYAAELPGDFDGDGAVNPVDVVRYIAYLFRAGPPPVNPNNADVNTDCTLNLVDVVILVNYVYRNGPAPAAGCLQETP